MANKKTPIADVVYPESRFGGYARCDGTVGFFSRIHSLLKADSTVLDIGCGRGNSTEDPSPYRRSLQSCQGEQRRVIGIDVDPAASANTIVDEVRIIKSVDRWPVDDNSIDLAFSDYVLEHVEKPDQFFAEVQRVLKPGGYFCARTPNLWGYVAIIAKLTPNRLHYRATRFAQQDRKDEDTFPTVYRCNTRGALLRSMNNHGIDAVVYHIEGEPNYLRFSRIAYRVGAIVHPLLPPIVRSTLLAFGQKRVN